MIKVQVMIDNFKDKENYYNEVEIIRNNKKIKIKQELYQKGDIYSITKDRYKELSKKGLVEKVKEEKTATEGE